MNVNSEHFGQRRPPLSVTIKGILERYPDGQIFKELVQNADDAGAKTVWFYIDERQHGTSNLPHPDLAKFQGPALVSANNACFTDSDWEGIQSLQQSVKADDPFKVGRFGIGFNSVYHVTDLPIIVSGNRLACFEPQEITWKRESGQSFMLNDLVSNSSDIIASLEGLADFDSSLISHTSNYPNTLFRLPLRNQASGLSENVYTIQRVKELLDALREEAKFLLLFLKSVDKIEVINVSGTGHQSLSFRVEVNPADIATVRSHRESFMRDLKTAHERNPFRITQVITFSANFSVVVTDHSPTRNQGGNSKWIVTNCVGSPESSIPAAAEKQKTFPWVGAAFELGIPCASGRIFCFLPMPVETSSGLPVHVHGTFGLNDERRTLKWPGVERKNDPTANWNKILVSQLLPGCYALLLQAMKTHVSPKAFYEAWPKVAVVEHSQFAEILRPLFSSLFSLAIVWTERTEALLQVGEWISVSNSTFISEGSTLPSVVQQTLSDCGEKLVKVPGNIWAAIRYNRVIISEVSSQLARSRFRSYPQSYSSISPIGKKELLRYCLKDACYNDLRGLNLLPLANGTFTNFDQGFGTQPVYLCSFSHQKSLLPNLDRMLVDIEDSELQRSLMNVASSQATKLKQLGTGEVASLLPQAMPQEWRGQSLVVLPNSSISTSWLKFFWEWLQNKDLRLFENQLIMPVYKSILHNTESFYLTKLSRNSSIVFKSQHISCSSSLLSALYKMNVMVCQQNEFTFVNHSQLTKYAYVKLFDSNGVLDAMGQRHAFSRADFSSEEADKLRDFLSGQYSASPQRKTVLENLCIFKSASNSSSRLYSVTASSSQSLARKALCEPSNSVISVENLPSNFILFSQSDYTQQQLLAKLQVSSPSVVDLILKYILPLIRSHSFPDHLIDGLMTEVVDYCQTLNSRGNYSVVTELSESIKSLPFLKAASGGRRSPQDLCDPSNDEIKALYEGKDVFPLAPFETDSRLYVLKQCGLRTAVQPQEVLDIISSISSAHSSQPVPVSSTKLERAKAVLKYITTNEFQRKTSGKYTLSPTKGNRTFAASLSILATKRNWLPVVSDCPQEYPTQLPWKGSDYTCHFVSLSSSVAVLSEHNYTELPFLVGSQMFLVGPPVDLKVANMLHTDCGQHIIPHFERLKQSQEELSLDDLDSLVHKVYSFFNRNTSHTKLLYSIEEWIFLRNQKQFVSPAVVALRHNETFRQDLEPYVHILPDTLSRYTHLFGPTSQISSAVSLSQILSVLTQIREKVQAGDHRSRVEEGPVMAILNWLTKNGTSDVAGDAEVLVPVESESEWPQLVEASEVVYTDNDFLKTFLQESDEDGAYTFVHNIVDPRLAKCLGVVPLSEFLDISEDTFADAGQYEPLTVRLKNILKDYKDGLTIIKELLQNADDAEATEVNICYDLRQHEQNCKRLFFSGMADAHGPALIVHNNKTFTDDDFTNITKLAGATKQEKHLKIGKFGIGFCSVYHMTDVPSFVSRDKLYIFDPTLSYLKKEIKNPSQPGKKTTFTNKFIANSRQLSPYDGLFGFERSRDYEGTMFRFPFRTSASELSGTCYSGSSIDELVRDIQKSSSSLLLFLQHVKCLTFHKIEIGETSPSVVLRVTRESVPLPITLALPGGVEVRRLSCYHKDEATEKTSHHQWLVSQSQENQSQRDVWSRVSVKFFTASVACPLIETGTNPSCYKTDPSFKGEIFCFLPLSQETGLPVHVSGNFAVVSNRRGIWTSDDPQSQTDDEISWNVTLMRTVIPKAYYGILVALKDMKLKGVLSDYLFHSLWPLEERLQQHNPWHNMVTHLYQTISSDKLFFSSSRNQWLFLSDCKFLKLGILCQSTEDAITPACVLETVQYLKVPMVDLPSQYRACFSLEKFTVEESKFTELFFQHLKSLEAIVMVRCEVIRHMLEVYAAEYDDGTTRSYMLDGYFKRCPCIPCTPDGTVLRQCKEVVDPSATFSKLFDRDESHFPVDELANRHLTYTALIELKMNSSSISMRMLIERAKTIAELFKQDKTKALERVKLILSSVGNSNDKETGNTACADLSNVPFLPVLPKPTGYHLFWKGQDCELMCGSELMTAGLVGMYKRQENVNVYLAGSQVVFVNEQTVKQGGCEYIRRENLKLVGLRSIPTQEEVVKHFKEVIQAFNSHTSPRHLKLVEATDTICRHIYENLNEHVDRKLDESTSQAVYHHSVFNSQQPPLMVQPQRLSQILRDTPCVWTGKSFVDIDVVAEQWMSDGPYLHCLPSSLTIRKSLKKELGIKEQFSLSDVQKALETMKQDFGDQPVNERCQKFLKDIVSLLLKLKLDTEPQNCTIMLPDEVFVLHMSSELVYNDVDWAPKDTKYTYVHDIFSPHLAKQLNVKPARSNLLNKYSSAEKTHFLGAAFGQREELTQRIQNILRDYPFDITVLKELLQNADDAKATKLYFILDKRTHGKQGILSEKWAELQGPALLVWNDSVFSEKDLQGIQELGMGSKRSDSETIGQHGIGFNVVYHLTDCPSFITGGETMCILDPHCRYVDGAEVTNPGRRFDNLSTGFWNDFPQMKSAYLQGKLDNCPSEMCTGSLFRFPLRHTDHHIRESKIVRRDRHNKPLDKPLTAYFMQSFLRDWAPETKVAMLFLNHITELRFFVIEENADVLVTIKNYCTKVDLPTQESREQLHKTISAFNQETGSESCVIRYPLTISEVCHSGEPAKETSDEKWLIQQGVGDIDNDQQRWIFVDNVKPRHGIAAPMQLPSPKPTLSAFGVLPSTAKVFSGRVFCFLPLPGDSKLPVHINGNFILDSNRRHLWTSSDSEREDDRSVWNNRIIEALASSYANLLEHASSFFVNPDSSFKTWDTAKDSVGRYYSIFPTCTLEKRYQALASNMYTKLVSHNSLVFAVIDRDLTCPSPFKVDWHPTKSKSLSTQIYFWRSVVNQGEEQNEIKPILENIGMKLTAAPEKLQNCFNQIIKVDKDKLQHTNPAVVFDYYKNNCCQVTPSGTFPCSLTKTVFKEVAVFRKFTEYLLLNTTPRSTTKGIFNPAPKFLHHFPDQPFSHPLLLTADGQLRIFQKEEKVIKSLFSHLFPNSKDKFLHPELFDIDYSNHYFVFCSPSPDKIYSVSLPSPDEIYSTRLVMQILSAHLSSQLKTTRVHKYEQLLSKEDLVKYWKCLREDPTFSSHVSDILNQWALLPTMSGSLYSYKDNFVPIIPPSRSKCSHLIPTMPFQYGSADFDKVYDVLVYLGIPFLDTGIVIVDELSKVSCPSFSAYGSVLETLFHLNREKDLSNVLDASRVSILLDYLQNIDFRNNPTCGEHVKALPMFQIIDDSFCSLGGKSVYIWPWNVLTVAYVKWVRISPNLVFLKGSGDWNILGCQEQLQIRTISAEEVYYDYIFRAFSNLNKDERYKHLNHIRDHLFPVNNTYMTAKGNNESKQRAILFISGLEKLPCLGEDGEPLLPVRDYCNHELEIFTTFKKHYRFLPEFFISNKVLWPEWLAFFNKIGLKQTVSKDEFLQFCNEIADGKHEEPVYASHVLFRHLKSNTVIDAGWFNDRTFLGRVATIAFVPVEPLHDLIWIRKAAASSNSLVVNGKCLSFAKPNEAAVTETSVLLWTVKPVVKLVGYMPEHIQEHSSLLNHLGVTFKPKLSDVIHNVRNIYALNTFTRFELFDKYPDANRVPNGAKGLMEVMINILQFLQSEQMNLTSDDKATLKECSCIPVYSTKDGTHSWQVVLVKPKSVLNWPSSEFHPFLHELPRDFSYLTPLLQEIGVKSVVELCHIQLVLETAHKCSSGQVLDENTKSCVFKALNTLLSKLSSPECSSAKRFEEISEHLKPLYLPTQGNKLALSTDLLYIDDPRFRGKVNLQLDGTCYSMLKVRDMQFRVFVFEEDFCKLLPKDIRPRGLSEISNQTILEECEEVEDSKISLSLKETLGMTDLLPKAIAACVKYVIKCDSSTDSLESDISKFLHRLKIITLYPLRLSLTFKETRQPLGNLETKFHVEVVPSTQLLTNVYLSSDLKTNHDLSSASKILSEHFLSVVKKHVSIHGDEYRVLKEIICTIILEAKTPSELREILDDNKIPLGIRGMDDFSFKLGEKVPECWHHKLDQSIENVFHPDEKIGYEDTEGCILFAQIMHPVFPEGVENFDLVPRISMRYRIYTSPDDEEGTEVSVLQLFKFIRGQKTDDSLDEEETGLVLYEGETEPVQIRMELRRENGEEIKSNLLKQLNEVWKLPENECNTAIRRLYLQWHPDKNSDNPDIAEEVFKFLNSEIDKRKSGRIDCEDWNQTASKHRDWFREEKSSSRPKSRGGGGGRYHQSTGQSYGVPPFERDNFDSPKKRPEEGKRWVKQAEANFCSLTQMFLGSENKPQMCGDVCFMAHQVAEKALKGGKYYVYGLDDKSLKSHNISTHAYGLQAERPTDTYGLVSHTTPLEQYYLDPRYPNHWSPPSIPADHYSYQQADEAKTHAEAILNIIKSIVV